MPISRGSVLGILTASAVIAGLVFFLLEQTDTATSPNPASAPGQGSAVAPEPTQDPRRAYPEGEAFVVSGVRFAVVASPEQQWARDVRAIDPGEGNRWELVSVLYRNIERQRLFAEDLRFRLQGSGEKTYQPSATAGNGGTDLGPGARILTGTLVKGQLAFAVPADEGTSQLLIDPSPQTSIRVRLGSG
ncbi:MAG: DUF4352 domain-containing protein [Solirubrobacteraceae bacterium]